MTHIPEQPVPLIVAGLSFVTLLVLVLPFVVKQVEHNLELFFLVMGAIAVTISGFWHWELVREALKAPVIIGSLPVGIFQVVLVFGLLIYFYNKPFTNSIVAIANKLGHKVFIFLLITILGFFSSIISVIVTAVLLSEIISALPFSKSDRIKMAVISCFALGLGAGLTPVGEPLSTIMVSKLSGPPYHAGFFFPLQHFGVYIIPGVIAIAIFGAFYIGRRDSIEKEDLKDPPSKSFKGVILRAVKVYVFIAALILLGEGLKPLVIWYITKLSAWILYWINIISAILDNATLTAVEIGPTMMLPQIISAILSLLISGGMLIPGNIPNIVAAGRLKITMKEWAIIGVPVGLTMMALYFIILLPTYL